MNDAQAKRMAVFLIANPPKDVDEKDMAKVQMYLRLIEDREKVWYSTWKGGEN